MTIEFRLYSELDKKDRDATNYIKIKRFVLRLSQSYHLKVVFNFDNDNSIFNFSLRYFDLEDSSVNCLKKKLAYQLFSRDFVMGLSDFFFSLYEQDRAFFQTFLSFVIKEAWSDISSSMYHIKNELESLGYIYDGSILKTTSGHPIIEQKIKSYLDSALYKIDPELLVMRNGAVEALLSNQPDKARHISASSRAMINTLLRKLAPNVELKEGESETRKRILFLFGDSESTLELVDKTASLIRTLNDVQSKGDHSKIDNELAFFIFELTDKLIYFILTYKVK